MRAALLASTILCVPLAARAQTVNLNLDSITTDGSSSSWMVGFPFGGSTNTLSANNETEWYSATGIAPDGNGGVNLTATPASITGANPGGLAVNSGAISSATMTSGMTTPGGFAALYGTFSAKISMSAVPGTWPAFWLEPVDGKSPCEIDVMEAPFGNGTQIQASIHDQPIGTGWTTGKVTVPNYSANFNTYSMTWTPSTITFSVNNQQIGQTPTPSSCNTPAYILANVATGGWAGNPSSSMTSATMDIANITYTPMANGPTGSGIVADSGLINGGSTSAATPTATAAIIAAPVAAPVMAAAASAPAVAAAPASGEIPAPPDPPASAQTVAATGTGSGGACPGENWTAGDRAPGGSFTDMSGNVWTLSPTGEALENGSVPTFSANIAKLLEVNGTIWHENMSGQWYHWTGTGWIADYTPPPVSQAQAIIQTTCPSSGTPVTAPTVPPSPSRARSPATSALAAPAAHPCPATAPGTRRFHVAAGQIIGPDGNAWIARGVNLQDNSLGLAGQMVATFTGTNFIRVNVRHYNDPSFYQNFVNQMTSQGRVVEFEDHPDGGGGNMNGVQVFTGIKLATELAWYAGMAKTYAGNPFVWFGTYNEPPTEGGDLSSWQQATYGAIRGAGNNAPILLETPGALPSNLLQGLNPSVYAAMTNTVWDIHIYGWETNGSTDPATNDANVAALAAATETIHSADGIMPVLAGEYGDSSGGYVADGNGEQNVDAVVSAGANGKLGSAAWSYPGGPADMLADGSGNPTDPFGITVQLYINTNVVPLTACQEQQQATQAIAAATAAANAQAASTRPTAAQ